MTTNQTVNTPLILCENLVKIYKVDDLEVVALQGLDLEVRKGEFLAIVGASGSGKSSLLNILGGLDRPSAGRVTVAGHDLLKLSDAALARYRLDEVGFVWQQASRNLLPYLTAQENVELPMLAAGVASATATIHALELLEAVGLSDRRRHRLAQLSGGQQQRIAIAVALANRPQLLLADEPTGEVDSATAQRIWQVLRQLSARYGLTTVIVSHDRAIARVVDRVVSIRDGKTSTETIRQRDTAPATPTMASSQANTNPITVSEERFEERTVLDIAGRLQIPREYLEQRGIKTRAVVQLVEEGILIQRIAEEDASLASLTQVQPATSAVDGGAESVCWW
ncbi:MAG: ABC transporter ATP-binding protein [Chloroflexi bacterium]|nr:ABC transporter ATP-binding protein [Chloroflexota bacterium]